MRMLSTVLIAVVSLAQAHAEEPAGSKSKAGGSCRYSVSGGETVELPVGASACFRKPPPYSDEYTLLQCEPPLTEVDDVKRGDPRCRDKYEDRERQK